MSVLERFVCTQTVVFYVWKRCGITARQTGTNQFNTKSSHDTTNGFYLKQKIFKKNATIFSSTHVRICVEDATSLVYLNTIPTSTYRWRDKCTTEQMRDKTPFEKGETIHLSLFVFASYAFLDESTTNDCPVSLNPGWEMLLAGIWWRPALFFSVGCFWTLRWCKNPVLWWTSWNVWKENTW